MSTTEPATNNATISANLWHAMRLASLGTLEQDAMPHVSMVTVSPLTSGTALLLLSDLARHTANIKRNPRCSLLVTGDQNQHDDPLAMERITVHGFLKPAADALAENKAIFLAHHPAAADYIDFGDFGLYCFSPEKIFLVGGFGRIETLAPEILIRPDRDDR